MHSAGASVTRDSPRDVGDQCQSHSQRPLFYEVGEGPHIRTPKDSMNVEEIVPQVFMMDLEK